MADYILLTGAKKNAGDYLIGERGRELLAHYRPDRSWETWDRFLPLDGRLDAVNRARAVILLGGPAYAAEFYPRIYPLTRSLDRISVPVIPLALGWSGESGRNWTRFQFSAASRHALRWIHGRIPASSCRDTATSELLAREGITNVVMTGCTAWHHLPSHNKPFVQPSDVMRVVVTTAANRRLYRQNVDLLERVQQRFPAAIRYCVFHRGIGWDRHTTPPNAIFHLRLARQARRLGYEVVDAAYDLRKLDFYHRCDVHVGYRVHAHLFFLSVRKPSVLLQEDGRGAGASLALGTPDEWAWDAGAVDRIMQQLDLSVRATDTRFAPVAARLDSAHLAMREFLRQLP